jgi:hypothetical protein
LNRGFGLDVEKRYGSLNAGGTPISTSNYDPDFWNSANSIDFKLNDDPIVRSGASRMNRRARAGVMKPTGSTEADADLQQLAWYFFGFLDNYVYTAGSGSTHTHEFYGGEGKELPSFRAIAMFDMLKKYINGMLIDGLKLEVSNENMTVAADWIYKTESAAINEAFTQPDELTGEQLFIMFYDVSLKMAAQGSTLTALDGVSTAFSYEGKNNHNVDGTIGLGSRYPQKRALAGKRENSLSITTTLTSDTARKILDAQYGEANATSPSTCKILQTQLEVTIQHCENNNISAKIYFPVCTLRVEYSMSGVDAIETTMTLDTLGTGTATLADGTTEVATDMYVKIVNNQEKIQTSDS